MIATNDYQPPRFSASHARRASHVHRCSRAAGRGLGVFVLASVLLPAVGGVIDAQTIDEMRTDQINRLASYVTSAILPSGLVRDSLVLDPGGSSFHPATPDAAGFALIALSALDHLDKLPDAAERAELILSAYAGHQSGVAPDRSADGHFIHFMNIATGAPAGGGWDASYSPIGSALLVAGAQFARNHFADNSAIATLADELTASVDFNAAIHPSLDGRIFLDMTKSGGGSSGAVRPWNEYMLVESLALREDENERALAVKHLWLDTDNIRQRSFGGIPTLTDSGSFAPAFWVQQMQFFNGDFRHDDEFQTFLENQQLADQQYANIFLGEESRYGLTAGVIPNGYHADRIYDHPFDVFSPEAVAAWGDLETLLTFYASQDPNSDPRYRFGMVRESAAQPNWIPPDAGLVDHLFLLFGLVESIDPSFFASRVFAPLSAGDYNADGIVDDADYALWQSSFGSESMLAADGNGNGIVDAGDFTIWRDHWNSAVGASGREGTLTGPSVPELATLQIFVAALAANLLAPLRNRRGR